MNVRMFVRTWTTNLYLFKILVYIDFIFEIVFKIFCLDLPQNQFFSKTLLEFDAHSFQTNIDFEWNFERVSFSSEISNQHFKIVRTCIKKHCFLDTCSKDFEMLVWTCSKFHSKSMLVRNFTKNRCLFEKYRNLVLIRNSILSKILIVL